MVSCYEAGRDGFWLHRYLQSRGIDNVVVDSASLEVDRRLRRAKLTGLMPASCCACSSGIMVGRGSYGGWCGCPAGKTRMPGTHRELEGLKRERTRHRNRIHGILMQQGLCIPHPSKKRFLKDLEALRTWNGHQLPRV